MKNLICPVSEKQVDEQIVRITASFVVLLFALYVIKGYIIIPLILTADFYIRGFTKLKYSPLSWISTQIRDLIFSKAILINKGPKIFAARIGLLLSFLTAVLGIMDYETASASVASVLVLFAFLECGLNFCAGCWVYTIIWGLYSSGQSKG